MGSTSDQASSMTKALETFEGAPCVDHEIQNDMMHASRGAFITQLEKSCRGMVAHFRRSSKAFIIFHNLLYRKSIFNFHVSSTGNDGITRVERGHLPTKSRECH